MAADLAERAQMGRVSGREGERMTMTPPEGTKACRHKEGADDGQVIHSLSGKQSEEFGSKK